MARAERRIARLGRSLRCKIRPPGPPCIGWAKGMRYCAPNFLRKNSSHPNCLSTSAGRTRLDVCYWVRSGHGSEGSLLPLLTHMRHGGRHFAVTHNECAERRIATRMIVHRLQSREVMLLVGSSLKSGGNLSLEVEKSQRKRCCRGLWFLTAHS